MSFAFLKGWRFWLSLTVLSAVLVTIYLGYSHYEKMVEENGVLKETVGKLKKDVDMISASNENAISTVGRWADSQKKFDDELRQLSTAQRENSQRLSEINELFAEHDLAELAARKPGLIERRVNAATARSIRMLKCTSGGGESCPEESAATPEERSP